VKITFKARTNALICRWVRTYIAEEARRVEEAAVEFRKKQLAAMTQRDTTATELIV